MHSHSGLRLHDFESMNGMELSDFEEFVRRQLAKNAKPLLDEDSEFPGELPNYLLSGLARDERFGHFELQRQLGLGGFGVVFLAKDTRSGEMVALKLPLPQVLISTRATRKFLRDGRTGLMLDHPGIVKVREIGEVDRIPYIASEYVEGPTLEKWLRSQSEEIRPSVAAEIVSYIADTLDYAHSKGVVHLDLKPANILLKSVDIAESARGFRPMITDFGLAHVKDEFRTSASTTSAAIVGSIPYMAPEQITGPRESIGPATDIYALGTIFYRMLTGSMPFSGLVGEALVRKIVYEQIDSARSRRLNVPVDLETICGKCLRKKPQRRFETAAALHDDLMRFRRGERILSRPISRLERTANWCRKYPTVTVMGMSTLAIIALLWNQNRELRKMNREVERYAAAERDYAIHSEKNLKLANDQKRLVQRHYYDRRLLDAQAAIDDRNDLLAQQILTEIDPGEADREFVWNYLWRKSREKMELIPIKDPSVDLDSIRVPGTDQWLVVHNSSGRLQMIDTRNGAVEHVAVQGRLDWFWNASSTEDGNRIRIVCVEKCEKNDCESLLQLRAIEWDTVTRSVISDQSYVTVGVWKNTTFRSGGDQCFVTAAINTAITDGSITMVVYRHDFRTGEWTRLNLPESMRLASSFSADGRFFAAVWKAGEVEVRDTTDFEPKIRLRMPYEGIPRFISFFDDNSKLAAIDSEGIRIHIWNLDRGNVEGSTFDSRIMASRTPFNLLMPLTNHRGLLARDNHGRLAVIAPESKRMSYLEIDPSAPDANAKFVPEHERRFLEYEGSLYANMRWDDNRVDKDRLKIWNLDTKRQTPVPEYLSQVLIWPSRSSSHFYGTDNRRLFEWFPNRTLTIPDLLGGHRDEAWCAVFTPDSQILVTGSNDTNEKQTIKAWQRASGKLLWSVHGHAATVSAMAMHPAGKLVATGALCESGNVRLWDTVTGQMKADLAGLQLGIRSLKFSPDGRYLAGGDKKGRCVIWDTASGKIVHDLPTGSDRVLNLAFSSDRRVLITGSEDGWVRAWNLADGKAVRELFLGLLTTVLAIGPDANTLAAIGPDGRINLWNFETGTSIRHYEMPGMRPWAIRIFPDGRTLAAGDKQGNLMIWDLETGMEKFRTKAHNAQINDLTVSPDGKTLVSCAHDGTVRLWHAGPEF